MLENIFSSSKIRCYTNAEEYTLFYMRRPPLDAVGVVASSAGQQVGVNSPLNSIEKR